MLASIKQSIFEAAGRLGRCSVTDTLVVAGVPRAGTTWLLELLRTLPGRKALNEPLLYQRARHEYGFGWHKYIAPGDEAPRQRQYLEQVLEGQAREIAAWFFEAESQPGKVLEHATRNRLIVKFCRLNRALRWFARQFDVQRLVLMVRHPCAVVASMLQQGAWKESRLRGHGPSRAEQALHGGTLPEALRDPFEPVLERITTQAEVLAVHWCLDHYVPLLQHTEDGYPWALAPYERLVTRGIEELRRITEALGVDLTAAMQNRLREPSSSVVDSVHEEPERQLTKWRRRLSERQIDDILTVIDEVGLSRFYTDADEPDYDRLNDCQKKSARWEAQSEGVSRSLDPSA